MSTQIIKTNPDYRDPKKRFRYDEPMLVVLLVDDMGEWAVYAGPLLS